jgi:hypothetical protein
MFARGPGAADPGGLLLDTEDLTYPLLGDVEYHVRLDEHGVRLARHK